ncbi:MAG TPA: flagellar assembly peptidoglycan hydrolase FlgJ [Steroidobacteraceae bacterium]|jgi:flagellar protein FlgJ
MASGVVNPDFYADFGALSSLGKQAKQNDPQAIREAARQFESLFTDMMLKSMRAAKLGDGMGDSQEGDFYQDMYDQQLAVQMSQGKGLGLADMLVQQLTRRGALGSATAAGQAAGSSTASTGTPAAGVIDTTAARGVGAAHEAAHAPNHGATGAGAGGPAAGKGPKAAGGTSLTQRLGFVQKLAPYAQRAAAALGVSADTLIAQAALETGWGRHIVSGAAHSSSNNLFGVKAGSSWQGTTASATTTEYSGGTARRVAQAFRTYGSVQQGVNDYVSLLQRRAAYAGAIGSGTDARAFAGALQRGGYASDPRYVEKLVATAATVRSLRSVVAAAGNADTASALAHAASGEPGAAAPGASFKVLAGVPISNGEEPA